MDKNPSHGSGGLSGNLILAALLLGGGAFVLHEVPLESTRPPADEPSVGQRFSDQDVDARLWQDPLGAVARAREELAKKARTEPEKQADEFRHSIGRLESAISRARNDQAEVTVLAVMLPGGPYAEYVERRRRSRYAVLSALNTGDYVPVDTEHLGYFTAASPKLPDSTTQTDSPKLPELVPFEWFERESRIYQRRRILILWLDDSAFLSAPFELFAQLFEGLAPKKSGIAVRWRIIGPPFSHGLRAMVDETSAESFDKTLFAGRDVHFLSPTATATDRNLLRSPRIPQEANDPWRNLNSFLSDKRISLLRTIGDDDRLADKLIQELELRGLKVQPALKQKAADAWETSRRLCPRGRAQLAEAPHHIAVVAEWDTLYSRSLRGHFMFGADDAGFCVERYHYVRGLDGLLPDRGSPPPSKEPSGKEGDRSSDNRRKDGSFIERAEGQSQFDYLRRLGERLRERDRELRASNVKGAGIRAIGVLGNDVHDKLLVLQALQPEFPNAIFFTTDLDARFLHPSQIAWTRNLVVASSFGLRLTDDLQEGTPPFRDSYQTSVFFAARLVLDQLGDNAPWTRTVDSRSAALRPVQVAAVSDTVMQGAGGMGVPDKADADTVKLITQADLDKWLAAPRVFEIGRTAAFDFSASASQALSAVQAVQSAAPSPTPDRCDFTLASCPDVHPPGTPRYPSFSTAGVTLLGTAFVLLLWLSARTLSPSLRPRLPGSAQDDTEPPAQEPISFGIQLLLMAVFAAVVASLLGIFSTSIVDWLTKDGKPISLLEGISIWPTVGILLFTLLLSLYLVMRSWISLSTNLDEIAAALKLSRARRRLEEEQEAIEKELSWSERLISIFRINAPGGEVFPDRTMRNAGSKDPGSSEMNFDDKELPPGAANFWRFFIVQGRSSSRCIRSAAAVAVVVCFGIWVSMALEESFGTPQRGQTSALTNQVLAVVAVLMMNFLVFYVGDATLFCVRLVRELRARRASWPKTTITYFESRLGTLPPLLLDQWIDLQFVALRTRSVVRLIYFPFIVLSLLLVSRSRAFDDWQMPTTLLLLALLSVAIVLASGVALRWAAENSRAKALADVKEAILQSRAPDAPRDLKTEQLELLQQRIEDLNIGAFAPFSQQPLLKAVLLPFAAVGGTTLMEYLALANI